jgi:hypothetical protein
MESLLDISVTGQKKAAELKAKGRRPKIDRVARSSIMRNTRDEIAAVRAIYDDEEERCDSAVMPHHANDNVGGNVAGDSIKARTIEPFHRLCTSQLLHKAKAMNQQLYYVGQQYRKNYYDAGGTCLSHPPAYEKPVDSYDEYRQVRKVLVDKCLPYHEAAKVLDALEIREVVEAIAVHGRLVVEAGREYSGRNHKGQARSAAITALGIGLMALKNHYDAAKLELVS